VLSREPAALIGLPSIPGIALPNQMPLSERNYATHALQATLPVYTGGRISAAVNAAEAGVQASGFERTRSEQAVKLDVAETYLNVLRAQRAGRRRTPPGRPRRPCRRRGRTRQAGLVARNDILSVAVAQADARQRRTQARNAAELAAAAYNRLLGRPLDNPVDVAEPPPTCSRPDIAALEARARGLRPEIALLGAHAEATDHEAEMERAGTRPQVGIKAAVLHEDNRYRVNQDMAQLMVGVQWDIFDGGVQRRADAARPAPAPPASARTTPPA
jgi:outer membrane protein TolC